MKASLQIKADTHNGGDARASLDGPITESAVEPGQGYRLGWPWVCVIFCWSHQENQPR